MLRWVGEVVEKEGGREREMVEIMNRRSEEGRGREVEYGDMMRDGDIGGEEREREREREASKFQESPESRCSIN